MTLSKLFKFTSLSSVEKAVMVMAEADAVVAEAVEVKMK